MTTKHIALLFQTDMRLILRDRSFIAIAVAPMFLLALLHPALSYVATTAAAPYIPLLVACTCLIMTLFPAYILSFAMIDEKDQHILPIIRIMPFSTNVFILYRLALGWTAACICCLATLWTTGSLPLIQAIAAAGAFACMAPITQMLIVSWAGNKIEAVAMFKFANMFWLLPLIGVFIPWEGRYIFGVSPTFWLFQWFVDPIVPVWSVALYGALIILYGAYLFRKMRTAFI